MKRLLAIVLVVVGCGGAAATGPVNGAPAPSSIARSAAPSPTATTRSSGTSQPSASPDALTPIVIHIVTSLDELQTDVYNGTDPTDWIKSEGEWAAGQDGSNFGPQPLRDYASAMVTLLSSLLNGDDPGPGIATVLALRAPIAALAPSAAESPPPAPPAAKTLVIKGTQTGGNTKSFTLAVSDYEVTVAGKAASDKSGGYEFGGGNVIMDLISDSSADNLVNEIVKGGKNYKFVNNLYDLDGGRYHLELTMPKGSWSVAFKPQ